jgi:Protein of unknown function (DUF1749)
VAFKTGDFSQQVVFIGGLTDGLLATEYVNTFKTISLYHFDWARYNFSLIFSKEYGATTIGELDYIF